jgi:hypothetical protein
MFLRYLGIESSMFGEEPADWKPPTLIHHRIDIPPAHGWQSICELLEGYVQDFNISDNWNGMFIHEALGFDWNAFASAFLILTRTEWRRQWACFRAD